MTALHRDSRIEQLLIERHGVTQQQLDQANNLNAGNRHDLLENLKQMGALTDRKLVEIEAEYYGNKIIHIKKYPLNPDTVALIPDEVREKHQLLPIVKVGNILTVATGSLTKAQTILPEIQKLTPSLINFVLAYPLEIGERLGEFAKSQANLDDLLEGKAKQLAEDPKGEDKLIEDPNGPVAQVVGHLLVQAVTNGASDIHFEPQPNTYRVRFREDGILHEIRTFDRVFVAPFSAAVKVMASLDIAETRMPQDGAISQVIAGRKIDFRVATYPTEYGEKIVLRILDSNKDWISIESLGLHPEEQKKLIQVAEAPQGLILVTGPTGSGKTSTLYAILKHLNTPKKNILTIEDPIEYRIGGIIQAQVNVKKGFLFATGLRAMMRLDPNVILVGEMRDLETAGIGMEAALTGHLVLSTIHTNSASQTISRLIDIGVERFAVASSLSAVVSQRLVRKVCDRCKVAYKPTPEEMERLGYPGGMVETLYKGKGCLQCRQEGYRGRIPVLELLIISPEMRAIIAKADYAAGAIFDAAKKRGMRTVHEDAFDKAQRGLTTLDEILRVLGRWK